MAQPKKVREYFEVAQISKMLRQATVGAAQQFATEATLLGKKDLEQFARFQEKFSNRIIWRISQIAEELFVQEFSDEEIDLLIEFQSSPTAAKLRALMPTMQLSVINFFTDNQEEIERVAEEVAREVFV